MKYIKSNRIYFEDGLKSGYLVIDQGKIIGFLNEDAKVEEYEDYGNARIIPGIFDTHNHGTYGYSLDGQEKDNDQEEEVRNYLKALTYEGVTSILPTADPAVFKTIAKINKAGYVGARMMGIHSEGPYLNRVGEKGRPMPHPEIDMNFVKSMVDDAEGMLKLVAIAPEIANADKAIQYFLDHGVKIAYAHSDLKSAEAREAIKMGISVATHTSNVMVGLHHRDIGGLGVLLMDEEIDCEVICDGLHVCLDFIEVMFRIKDKSKFMMISDSSQLAGIKPGVYDESWHLPVTVTEEGFLVDSDGRLCGSSKSVLFGIANLVEKLHIPMESVIRMASYNPAKVYGCADRKGCIQLGYDADFVVISDDYKALSTYVEGTCVFNRKEEIPEFNPNFSV